MKALLLDLGGVIVPYDYDRAYRRLAAVSNMRPAEIRSVIAESGLYPEFERGKLPAEEFAGEICRLLCCRMPAEQFYSVWQSIFLTGALVPARTLAALAGRFRLVAVSDTNTIHYSCVRRLFPELSSFHAFALSFEIGDVKPSERVFRRALELARCEPEECTFIDDVEANVNGAMRLGIPGLQFQGGDKLNKFLCGLL